MGKVWQPEAVWKNVFTSPYGTIVSLSESPIKEGLIVVGTDDGQIQITENGGTNWKRYNKFPGVPDKTYVADVITSHHDSKVIIAVFNNHKEGDFTPYVLRSANLGKTWKRIDQGIEGSHTCWSILEDHSSSNLLFCGTEFGVYCSLNGGESWLKMKGGLPVIPIRDMEIQKREDDLVLATFGRGMWILDDYSPLRVLSQDAITGTTIFPIKDSWRYFEKGNKGYRKKGSFGDNFYTANNDHIGPKIRLYLNEKYTSLADNRKKESNEYPSYEALKQEDLETDDKYYLITKDDQGNIINTTKVKNRKGYHEVVIGLSREHLSGDAEISRNGPAPLEGNFSVELMKVGTEGIQSLAPSTPFRIDLLTFSEETPSSDYYEFYLRVTEELVKALQFRKILNKQLEEIQIKQEQALKTNNGETIRQLNLKRRDLLSVMDLMEGDETLIKRSDYHHRGLISRLNNLYWNMWQSMQITNTHRDQFEWIETQIREIESKI